jgi:ABC-2 type transport system ATP-binding protein
MHKPPVLFLDEPTTGLDITSRNELWEMIRELVSDGTTVLLTTQYLEEADIFAQRIAVVDGGRVIANDTPAALKAQLGSTVFEMDMPEGDAERAVALLTPVVTGRVEREGEHLRITSEHGARALIEILRALDVAGLEPQSLTVREPSLDDVFLALTGRHAEATDGEADVSRGDAA